jgi:predicted DNA-binding protein (MmcQ/YjbR family)
MAHGANKRTAHEQMLIARVSKITASLPSVTHEVDGLGHTTFRVGKKSFVIVGSGENGEGSLSIKCDLATQDSLIRGGRYERTPYIGKHGWVSTGGEQWLEWTEIEELVRDAYRAVAPKKLLKELE